MKKIHVHASTAYDILIQKNSLDQAGMLIRESITNGRIALISDDHVYALYGKRTEDSLHAAGFSTESYYFASGEGSKNLETYGKVLNFLCEHGFTRKDVIVALGGGVVGDLAGFAAATYRRGIRFVQIPTTLLAMVDSSVGGKTAIDLPAGKNQAGCFYQPSLVICDPALLNTLPEEEYRCGCAEVIKYAILESEALYRCLMDKPVKDQPETVIEKCVSIKRDYVLADEYDRGLRMKLNLGHTVGHCIEALSGFTIHHGQAVAMGMAGIATAAHKAGYCNLVCKEKIFTILEQYGLLAHIQYSPEEIMEICLRDKKFADGVMNLIVPVRIGKCEIVQVSQEELLTWIHNLGIVQK